MVRELGPHYSVSHVGNMLRGTSTDAIKKAGHNSLAVFGAGKSHTQSVADAMAVVRKMIILVRG